MRIRTCRKLEIGRATGDWCDQRENWRPPSKPVLLRVGQCFRYLEWTPHALIAPAARFGTAGVFWCSGETKVEGLRVTEFTVQLFRGEYKVLILPQEIATDIAAFAEHAFPAPLVLGPALRLSALSLVVMTAVIQLFVYPQSWLEHLTWITSFLFIIAHGPRRFSVDHLVRRALQRRDIL